MSDKIGSRMLRPQNIKDISNRLGDARSEFLGRIEHVTKATVIFAMDVSGAIGDISVEEATQGIIDFFTDEMRK